MPSDRVKKAAAANTAKARDAAAAAAASSSSSAEAPPKTGGTPASSADACIIALPPTLTARQRAALHAAAEAAGVPHASSGEGAERALTLGAPDAAVRVAPPADAPLSDADLCTLLREHLRIDAAPHFATTAAAAAAPPTLSPAAAAARARGFGERSALAAAKLTLEEFVARTGKLLELEREADIAQAAEAASLASPERAQARGRALLNLRLSEAEGGLLGRTLLTLVANKGFGAPGAPPPLPPHKFGPHDVVAIRPNAGGGGSNSSNGSSGGGPPIAQGLVYRVREGAIVVAVDDLPEDGLEQPLRLEKLANEVTYKRLRSTLDMLLNQSKGGGGGGGGAAAAAPLPGLRLAGYAYGGGAPRFAAAAPAWAPVNARLDASQVRAVGLALRAHDFALIHGPPGTGKTTAVVEVILQEAARGSRVLACAASNVAVDNLVERLSAAAPKLRVLRLGHPARLLPAVLDASLEAAVLRSDNSALARDCRKEIKDINSQLVKLEPWKRAERRQLRGELKQLYKEERERQERAVKEVIASAHVIACTLSGALHPQLAGQRFDVCVIDEAAQALEAACWSALLLAGRAVLAGDHLQLPPTVLSDEAARAGLGVTLFERLQAAHGAVSSEMLTVQYRMNSAIMDWASAELYGGLLTAHDSVAAQTLGGLARRPAADAGGGGGGSGKGSKAGKAKKGGGKAAAAAAGGGSGADASGGDFVGDAPVLLLIDTAGCGFEEQKEDDGDSIRNEGEARAALAHARRLVASGLSPADVGVIAPYSAQVALLKELRLTDAALGPALEVSTVDGFQGREKEAIIITAVRSSAAAGVGFLADARRMNVAVTRARRHCALVCDSETLRRGDAFLGRLVDYFEAHAEIESAEALAADFDGGGTGGGGG